MKKFLLKLLKSEIFYKGIAIAYFTFFVQLATSTTLHAYIDPATTSMVVQIVAGVLISLGFAIGLFRRKIAMFFKNLKVKTEAKKIERKNK